MSSPRPSHLSQVNLQQETVRWNASSHFHDALALENCRPMPEGDTVQPRGVGLEGWRVLRNGQSRGIFALLPYFIRGGGFWKIFWAMILDLFFWGGDFGGFLHLEWAIRHDGGCLYVWCLDNLLFARDRHHGGQTNNEGDSNTYTSFMLNHETSPQQPLVYIVGG
jgi:hypothetical protein